MVEAITLTVNGAAVRVPEGTTVAAAVALAQADQTFFHRSVSGEPRAPLCGMGICFECCVHIDGRAHQRSCQTLCRPGMEVHTDG